MGMILPGGCIKSTVSTSVWTGSDLSSEIPMVTSSKQGIITPSYIYAHSAQAIAHRRL